MRTLREWRRWGFMWMITDPQTGWALVHTRRGYDVSQTTGPVAVISLQGLLVSASVWAKTNWQLLLTMLRRPPQPCSLLVALLWDVPKTVKNAQFSLADLLWHSWPWWLLRFLEGSKLLILGCRFQSLSSAPVKLAYAPPVQRGRVIHLWWLAVALPWDCY